jgi:hypothetical protein
MLKVVVPSAAPEVKRRENRPWTDGISNESTVCLWTAGRAYARDVVLEKILLDPIVNCPFSRFP